MMTNFGRLLHVPADFRKKASQSPKSAASVNSNFTSSTKGTIRPNPNLNAELAARQLNAAFQGIKSDAVTIINILTTHSNHQRQKIKRHYKILYVKVSTHIRVIKFTAFLYLQITYILQI
ncbi:Annexin A7 [Zootermopsis nevadensis]|uniref:Annexin A7 n=1 Tax=Zootermopsis nevadensis TaxID=136037 RepID=A0A067QWP7_ZOONE|nr:Annexin A7 [Zootermopsis nevadensis]